MVEKIELTNMCMIIDGKRVLVQNRVNSKWAGWTFPGGHVEQGESFVESVVREVKEETGLDISQLRLCGSKQWQNDDTRYVVLLYIATKFKGDLCASEEGEVFWTDIDELLTVNKEHLAPTFDELVKVFLNEDISEQFWSEENKKFLLLG